MNNAYIEEFKMTKKNTRILIADQQHCRRLHIEKMLNQLGYYRIAPLDSFEEAMAATRFAGPAFDLVIINIKDNLKHKNIKEYCRKSPLIRNALYYNDQFTECEAWQQNKIAGTYSISSNIPELESIQKFMNCTVHPARRVLPGRNRGRTMNAPLTSRLTPSGEILLG